MDEPLLFVTRLDDLASMALTENPYERAAVYAATYAIYTAFLNSKLVSNHPVMELVRAACFYISAAAGYEFTTNNTPQQCVKKAHAKLDKLRNAINTYYY